MLFEQLESKIQQVIDTIMILQIEIENLKEQNIKLNKEIQEAANYHEILIRENEQLKEEQNLRQERLRSLLDRMDEFNS
ncbi:Cell division protein ZapB [Candidatus Profftia lariciata]|uniref:cell division protein ZapB n=1 Tax=Candidatus Profftia lariciata TaxID=1987921 RepID=UPI001D00D03F|nr:cell division protein ZapB [Candidatus Profftia lariciata]UDG81365.1 Cell division protein ZapB [Candidatus Profftia lariciata]